MSGCCNLAEAVGAQGSGWLWGRGTGSWQGVGAAASEVGRCPVRYSGA